MLPEISRAKPSPSEVAPAMKSTSQSAPSFLEDSGLELRGTGSSLLSRPSTAGSTGGRGWGAKSPPGRFTPSPPPGARAGMPKATVNARKVAIALCGWVTVGVMSPHCSL